jgi:hypothetical protein
LQGASNPPLLAEAVRALRVKHSPRPMFMQDNFTGATAWQSPKPDIHLSCFWLANLLWTIITELVFFRFYPCVQESSKATQYQEPSIP